MIKKFQFTYNYNIFMNFHIIYFILTDLKDS